MSVSTFLFFIITHFHPFYCVFLYILTPLGAFRHELSLIDHEFPLIISDNWLCREKFVSKQHFIFLIIGYAELKVRGQLVLIRAETAPKVRLTRHKLDCGVFAMLTVNC